MEDRTIQNVSIYALPVITIPIMMEPEEDCPDVIRSREAAEAAGPAMLKLWDELESEREEIVIEKEYKAPEEMNQNESDIFNFLKNGLGLDVDGMYF